MRPPGLACAFVVVACGGGGRASVAPAPVPEPAAITIDTILGADSTRCVVARLERSAEPLGFIATTWGTPDAAKAAYRATLARAVDDRERASLHYRFAADRALVGDLEAAREARDEAKRLAAGETIWVGERSLGLWLGDAPDDEVRMDHVPVLVRGGQRAAAEAEFAQADGPLESTGDAEFDRERAIDAARDVGEALSALGRVDDLQQRIAASDEEVGAALARGWLQDAVVTGVHLDDAVKAVSATGAKDLPDALFERAHYLGRGAALAPLVAANLAEPEVEVDARLGELRLAILVGDHATARAIADEVAHAPPPKERFDRRSQAPLFGAFAGGTLDEGLAAIHAYDGFAPFEVTGHFYGALWARHVAAGFDPAFDQRLTESVCAHPPACVVDATGWSTVRVGADGVSADLAALRAGISETCGLWVERPELRVLLAPGGRASRALETIAAAFEAGYDQVEVRELAAPDDPIPTARICTWTGKPSTNPPDDAGFLYLSTEGVEGYVGDDGYELPALAATAAPDEVAAWVEGLEVPSTWLGRAQVSIAVADDVTTEGLARILFPVCEQFGAVHFHEYGEDEHED